MPDLSKAEIKVTKVAGDVYMLQSSDAGNIAALVGEDGIVLVDDEYAPLATKIAAALKGIGVTDKPVRFIINTHYHYDHTGGNAAFANQGSTIIAHDNARARLASWCLRRQWGNGTFRDAARRTGRLAGDHLRPRCLGAFER